LNNYLDLNSLVTFTQQVVRPWNSQSPGWDAAKIHAVYDRLSTQFDDTQRIHNLMAAFTAQRAHLVQGSSTHHITHARESMVWVYYGLTSHSTHFRSFL